MSSVLVIGAGGIGAALADLASGSQRVVVASRSQPTCAYDHYLPLDLDRPQALSQAVLDHQVDCVINTLGVLHDSEHSPEKSVVGADLEWFLHSMRVNCGFSLSFLAALTEVLPRSSALKCLCFSARVGSISDNRLGGWISYRSSKAALNMVIKTVAVEWTRRLPEACLIAYHPGTVVTPLSQPFLSQAKNPMTPEQAAQALWDFVPLLTPAMSGGFYDWAQQPVPF